MKMKSRKLLRYDRPAAATPVAVADESLVVDVRGQIGPAEMVELRLQRLLPTGNLPLNSTTFRHR